MLFRSLVKEGSAEPVLPQLEALHATLAKHSVQGVAIPYSEWMLGTAYLSAKRTVDAEKWARRIVESTKTAKARLLLARVFLAKGDIDGARSELTVLMGNESKSLDALHIVVRADWASVKLAQNDIAGALFESEKALALWPKHTGEYDVRMLPYIQRIRADVLAANGQFEEAQRIEDEGWKASLVYDAPESPTAKRRVMTKK